MHSLQRIKRRALIALGLIACAASALAGDHVVIIGHANVRKLDAITVQRIYMGKIVEVDGTPVVPLNAAPGQAPRQRFLADYLQQDEDKFVAYWTVRRYVGKGTPPREVKDSAAMVEQVSKTPGAIGYVDEGDVTPGMNVLLRK
jgi:ABC-type phosphate transport system substrate-binding protein